MNSKIKKILLAIVMVAMISTQTLTHVQALEETLPNVETTEETITEDKAKQDVPETDQQTETEPAPMGSSDGEASTNRQATFSDSGNFTGRLEDRSDNKTYYGGSQISMYQYISGSGATSNLAEGSYQIISFKKDQTSPIDRSDFDTSGTSFVKDIEINNDGEYRTVKLVHKELKGGIEEGRAFTIKIAPKVFINGDKFYVKQEFYNSSNQKLSEFSLPITVYSINGDVASGYVPMVEIKKDQMSSNYLINDGVSTAFDIRSFKTDDIPKTDRRDRRITAVIPAGTKLSSESAAIWKSTGKANEYYTDIKRDDYIDSNKAYSKSIKVNLGGINLKDYSGEFNTIGLKVNYSMVVLDGSQVVNELGTTKWDSDVRLYRKDDTIPPLYWTSKTIAFTSEIDENYNRIVGKTDFETRNSVNYAQVEQGAIRIKDTHQLLKDSSWSKPGISEEVKSVTIEESIISIPYWSSLTGVRLNFISSSATSAQKEEAARQLKGTQVIGVYMNDRVPVEEVIATIDDLSFSNSYDDTFNSDGIIQINPTKQYFEVKFKYPNGGIKADSEQKAKQIQENIHTETFSRLNKDVVDKRLSIHQYYMNPSFESSTSPSVKITYNSVRENETSMHNITGFSEKTLLNYLTLDFAELTLGSNVKVGNDTYGQGIYENNKLLINGNYTLLNNSTAGFSSSPENMNMYFVIPEGFIPTPNQPEWSKIDIIYNYATIEGLKYNLAVAKPSKTITVTTKETGVIESQTEDFTIKFDQSQRIKDGNYNVGIAIGIDNNDPVYANGKASGIYTKNIMTSSPIKEYFGNIYSLGLNSPTNPNKLVNNGKVYQIQVRPPLTLRTYTDVKKASDDNSAYSASTGSSATIGDEINYRWNFYNGGGEDITQLTAINVLPYANDHVITEDQNGEYPARGSHISTPLKGAISSNDFKIEYSTDTPPATQDGLNNISWTSSPSDYSKVTMIKATLLPGKKIARTHTATIIMNNKIPNDSNIKDNSRAVDSFAYTRDNGINWIEAQSAEAKVVYPRINIKGIKVDESDPTLRLMGARFDLYNANNELIYSGLGSDSNGEFRLSNLAIGETYKLVETKAPEGYAIRGDMTFKVTGAADQVVTVTNSNVAKKSVTIDKQWVGGPAVHPTISVQLYQNDTKHGDPVELPNGTTSHTWTGLDIAPIGGDDYVYTVQEAPVANYSTTINGFTITNTYQEPNKTIEGTKKWVDGGNIEGFRPSTIEVKLYANGTDTGLTPTWEKPEATPDLWKYKFENVPSTKNGVAINYTVEEAAIDGYIPKKEGFNFTNTHTVETVNVSGTKKWVDGYNVDAIRPENITVNLLANGNKTKAEINWKKAGVGNDTWEYEFANLPKHLNGEPVVYTVEEEAVDGYNTSITDYNIINTHEIEKTVVSGTKTWVDEDNRDGVRPSSIVIELYADGKKVDNPKIEWSETDTNVWKYEIKDLPLNRLPDSGPSRKATIGPIKVNYTVKELSVASYTSVQDKFDFVNTHTIETDNVVITKKWDDNSNTDGLRPSDISIVLRNQEKSFTTQPAKVVVDKNTWTYTYENLPVNYNKGQKLSYSVEEQKVTSYDTAYNGLEITNSHSDETTTVSGTKTWADASNQDGIRPTDLTLILKGLNGEVVTNVNPTWTKNGDTWTYTYAGLPKNHDGVAITYKVEEVVPTGYTSVQTGNNFTNTHTPITKNIEGTKTWSDNSNQDDSRPDAITIKLKNQLGEVHATPTWIKNGDTWTYTYEDLPVYYNNGTELVYEVEEAIVPGYSVSYDGLNLTNSRASETTTVSGTKTWADASNQDGIRPTDLTLILKGLNGEVVTNVNPTWTKNGDTWTYTYAGLPKNHDGVAITYKVEEVVPTGYTSVQTGNNFTNTHTPITKNIEGTKTWSDNSNQDDSRPDAITIKLKNQLGEVHATPTWVKNGDTWTYTYEDLPVYYNNGTELVYEVEEAIVPGYSVSYDGLNFTNSRTAETTTISGTKTWKDDSNRDGVRPSAITLELRDSHGIVNATPKWTNTDTNTWTYTYTGLPKNENGTPITYTVTELPVTGYESDSEGYNFTNTHTPITKTITGTKTWKDSDNQDGLRPDDITVTLYANGTAREDIATWNKDDKNNWVFTFENVPVNDKGTEINYTVDENEVTGYNKNIVGFDITNTHTADTTSIEGTKTWEDMLNSAGFRPEEITINLFAGGQKVDNFDISWNKSNENVWKYQITNLPKKEDGKDIVYTVSEEAVEHYETKQTGNNFTNTHIPTKVSRTGTKVWEDSNNQDGLRPANIVVKLLANGKETEFAPTWIKDTGVANQWKFTFDNLPEFSGGKEITYTIKEKIVQGYESKVTGFNLVNTHKAGTVEISGTKTWVDEDNLAGFRPQELTVNLFADGNLVEGLKPEWTMDGNVWTYKFANLDEMKNGTLITYTVKEGDVDHYTPDQKDFNFTNTHVVERTDISGTKTWDDASDQDGFRPTTIDVKLLANGNATAFTPEWTNNGANSNKWTYEFKDVPVYKDGNKITYSVEETSVPRYTTDITGFDITNSYTPNTISVGGTKTWDDNSNSEGFRPSAITVVLSANGKELTNVPSWDKTADNKWTYEFAGLPEKDAGQVINYTVKELAEEHYDSKQEGRDFTNTHTPTYINVEGTKVWDDNSNQDGVRPTTINLILVANGEDTTHTPVWTNNDEKSDVWSYSFTNLPEFKDGKAVTYTLREEEVTGYESTINKYEVTNKHDIALINIEGTKTWDDASNQDGARPESIVVTLFANGEKVDVAPTWTMNENTWDYVFKDQPKFKEGKEITYTLTEDAVDGYDTTITGYNITNKHDVELMNVTGMKTWADANNQDGKRPEAITITLYANGVKVNADPKWTMDGNEWTYVYSDQPVYANGTKINYTVKEDAVTGYESSYNLLDITNTHEVSLINIEGTKTWDDASNQDGVRPDKIDVTLYANGKAVDAHAVWTKDGDTWTYVFKDLPEYSEGTKITYTISEDAVDGYTSEITEHNLTNKHEVSLINIEGTKVWDDASNKDGIRPESINVTLYANGKAIDAKAIWTKVGDTWTYVFKDLPEYSEGTKVQYTVSEDSVKGYESAINGFTITNTHKPANPVDPIDPVKPVDPTKPTDKKTPTGVSNEMGTYVFMGALAMSTGLLVVFKRKKKEQE